MKGTPRSTKAEHIPQGHIDWGELSSLALVYVMAKAFLVFPERMSSAAQTAAWSVPLFSGLISTFWVWALVVLMKAHPGQDLVSITKSLASPAVGVLFGAVFFVYVVGITAAGGREVADAVVTVIMPLTPLDLTITLLYVVATYLALTGLENLARVATFGIFMVVGLILALSILSLGSWDWRTLYPLLGPGLAKLGKTYFVRQAVFGELLSLGIFGAYLRNSSDAGKAARRTLISSAVVLTLVVLNCQMVFPYPSLDQIPQPLLRVTRLIYLGRFFQRFDAFFVPVWLAAGTLKAATGILLGALALGSTFSIKHLNILILVTAAIIYTASTLFPNFALTAILDFDIVRPYSTILLDVWTPGLLLLHFLRRRRSKGGKAPS